MGSSASRVREFLALAGAVLVGAVLVGAAFVGCQREPASKAPTRSGIELVEAPPAGEVAAIVRDQLEGTRQRGRKLLVYVGATWCEPCKAFRAAAQSGHLDEALPGLTLLEFDADRDDARLKADGYGYDYVPMLVVPDESGRGSARRTSGVQKGQDPVAQLVPRVRALLQ